MSALTFWQEATPSAALTVWRERTPDDVDDEVERVVDTARTHAIASNTAIPRYARVLTDMLTWQRRSRSRGGDYTEIVWR